ncbi:MAG: hypothetical protein IT372_15785 [Polyangiaceae bacterium]|nr:hypothetical protein [Polyangiaceae bacterium]
MQRAKFKVHASVSPTQMERSLMKGGISGSLFVEIDDTFFPARDWYDYILPVLGWWIESAMRLNMPESEAEFRFMDGPHEIRMRRSTGTDDVTVTMWSNGRLVTDRSYIVSYMRTLASIRGAAKSVINDLRAEGFVDHPETSTLQTRLEHLMRLESEVKARGLP